MKGGNGSVARPIRLTTLHVGLNRQGPCLRGKSNSRFFVPATDLTPPVVDGHAVPGFLGRPSALWPRARLPI